jgi:hypothetical protein
MIDTVPTLLLWIVAVTLPSLVSISDKIIGFWTKTGENRSRMIKATTIFYSFYKKTFNEACTYIK